MGRSPCCEKEHTNKGAWTKEEDERLTRYITQHGEGCWRTLPKAAGLLRCGKSCRLRWINYLRPDLKRGNFTQEEDDLIIKLHSLLGNKWSLIAARLPGRTDNEIKNYWNTHIKRKLLSRGIDPQTHRPLISLSAPAVDTSHSAAATSTTTTTEDSNGSSGGLSSSEEILLHHTTNPPINLELSISLPQQPSTAVNLFGKEVNDHKRPPVCLCCNLGFLGSNACDCDKVKPAGSMNAEAHRFYTPLSL